MKKILCIGLVLSLLLALCSCGAEKTEETAAVTNLPQIDMAAWRYDEENDVYWQVGISYCETPADETYETMGFYVPGAYMTGTANGDGTYTCTIDNEGEIGGYSAATAPVVIPVNTPGYAAMEAPTDYDSSTAAYTSAGFVYLAPGCRGRDAGAPAGVADLKAAIRYARYNEGLIPGDMNSIFSFGMSGGGAQSALLGASGNSDLYTVYLEQIGAVSGVSDAVKGSMCWCPITGLDIADEAYEWNMGSTRSDLSETEQKISDALAASYADYVNSLGLKDENGNALLLEESSEGINQSGSYYEYMKSVIEESLENFLQDTSFPYDTSKEASDSGMPMKGDMKEVKGNLPSGGDLSEAAQFAKDGIERNSSARGMAVSGVFETPQDYIDALNAEGQWVSYDAASGKVTIASLEDFTSRFKNASKSLGAFDQLDAGQGENTLFGYGDGNGAHFDSVLSGVLSSLASEDASAEVNGTSLTDLAAAYETDLQKTDGTGNTVDTRLSMYTPLYYLLPSYEGYGSSDTASYWRIRTGINQGDTALCTEVNLALALEQNENVKDVDFASVWGEGHTTAERSGSSDENCIAWINQCMEND